MLPHFARYQNRFGAVNELGVFAMVEAGLKEVKTPAPSFKPQRRTRLRLGGDGYLGGYAPVVSRNSGFG